MNKEIWRDIKDYEGLYQVSNLGNVKSLEREVWNGYSFVKHKERILRPRYTKKGYVKYSLYKNNKPKQYNGHWLVLSTFVKNVDNKPQINHKNGIKDDNRLFNLEYCTNSENQIHALENNLTKIRKRRYKFNKQNSRKCLDKYRAIAIEKAIKKISKPILELDKNNNIIKRFNSCKEAERYYNKRIHLENNKRFIKESEYYGM